MAAALPRGHGGARRSARHRLEYQRGLLAFCFDEIKALLRGPRRDRQGAQTLTGSPTTSARWRNSISGRQGLQRGRGPVAGICKRQSRDTRTTWNTLDEGKAVLSALNKHAQSLAIGPRRIPRPPQALVLNHPPTPLPIMPADLPPSPRHAETCHPRHLHRPQKRPQGGNALAMKVKMFYSVCWSKETEHFPRRTRRDQEAIKSHTMLPQSIRPGATQRLPEDNGGDLPDLRPTRNFGRP